ncbi:MAG: hypothetical protein IPP49_02480 [Saprospiraceae bacterium]|nr:hypothetical protein [Saprospiraceae bacterium]
MTLLSQANDNSPYSRFGIGEITDNNFNHSRQMGGLGASYIDGYHINIVNPASYSFLNATAFDFGVFAKRTWLTENNTTNKIWSGNLDYLSLAFPLRNPINEVYDGVKKDYKLGMSFTLMPHSFVNYNIVSVDSLAETGPFTRNYVGSGGSYKFMWGNALKYKNVSAGVNLGYLFGKLQYDNKLIFGSDQFAYSDFFSTDYNVKGFLWNAGVIYSDIINKKAIEKNKSLAAKRISVGLHANSATGFNTSYNVNHRLVQQLLSGIFNIDTIKIVNSIKGKGKLPAEFGLGATYYSGEKFVIGANYVTTLWSEYFNDASSETKGSLTDASKISVGGYYRPNYKSFDNFFERVYYRYGVYYNRDPRIINNEQLTTYGFTFGLGMPFVYQRKVSHVNLGLNAGIRGENTPISEKFVKISLGENITIN